MYLRTIFNIIFIHLCIDFKFFQAFLTNIRCHLNFQVLTDFFFHFLIFTHYSSSKMDLNISGSWIEQDMG